MGQTVPPPASIEELSARLRALAGRTLRELAAECGQAVPTSALRAKGWTGQLIEMVLGATAGSRAEPDFQAIGVELKTIPLNRKGQPRESTYVCTVPLDGSQEPDWDHSWVRGKLRRVLWLPVQAAADIPLGERRVGSGLLWDMEPDLEAALRADWEELMDMVCLGQLERVTAHHGSYLQIRPKAADSRALRRAVGADGEPVVTNPRGFYLRTAFTREILRRYYAPMGS